MRRTLSFVMLPCDGGNKTKSAGIMATEKKAGTESKPAAASDGSVDSSEAFRGGRRLTPYLQSLAQISGIATIIAATVYALGVFTLVLPISRSYNSTFPAAWYTVSVVPKTVVVGHGIRSLFWPSLVLTLTTTLSALMVLWVLYVMSIGWRHARQTESQPTLNLTSLAIIYSVLALVFNLVLSALFPAWVKGSKLELPSSDVAFYAQRSLTFMSGPLDILIVLLCSASALLVLSSGVHYMRRLITSRAVPSLSFRGFIMSFRSLVFRGLVLAWLAWSLLFAVSRLENGYVHRFHLYKLLNSALVGYLVILFFLLAFVAMLLLILSALRYIWRIIMVAKRNKVLPSPSVALAGWGGSGWQRIRAFAPTLSYSAVLFLIFYVAALVALNVLYSVVFPLIDNTSGSIKSETWLDELFVPLVVFGAFISLAIMYRKGWRGLGRGEDDPFFQGGWLSVWKGLLRSIGSRSLRSGLFWSLGVAYVIALASAFLLAYLNPPPLPKVEVNEVAQAQSVQPKVSNQDKSPPLRGKR
jgi:hypothetical protein